jgi:hypothetical protein
VPAMYGPWKNHVPIFQRPRNWYESLGGGS